MFTVDKVSVQFSQASFTINEGMALTVTVLMEEVNSTDDVILDFPLTIPLSTSVGNAGK